MSSRMAKTTRLGGRYATSIPPAIPTKYPSGGRGLAWYSSFSVWSIRMYAASFSTRCPMRNIEYTSAPINVTGNRSAARMATKMIRAPGVSVPVRIASHSWSCTRISVAKKAPEPDHRSPKAIRSLRVDRPADNRQERFLEGHRTDCGRETVPKCEVHDLVDPLRPRDDVEGVPLFDDAAEGLEQVALVAPVLDRDTQRAANLALRTLRGPFEEDTALLDDVQPFRERLGFVKVMRREQDRRSFSGELPEHVPHGSPRERVEPDRRLVQEHEGCLRRHDRGHHRPLLLTPAQGDAEAISDVLESHLPEGFLGANLRGLARNSSSAKVAVDLLTRRQVEEGFPFLRHDGDQGSNAFRFLDHVEAERVDRPRGRDQQGRRDAKEGGLACAVPPEKRHALHATNGEGHTPERLDLRPHSAAVHLADVPRAEGLLGQGPVQANSAYKARFRVRSSPRFLGARRLAPAHHRECRLSFRRLLLLAHLDRHRDGPDVAERILELAIALSPELVLERQRRLRACVEGLVPKFVDVLGGDVQVHGRRSRGRRRLRISARELIGHHDDGIPNPDRGVHQCAIGHRRSIDLLGAEGPLVKLDRLRCSVDHQVWRHGPYPPRGGGRRRGLLRGSLGGFLPRWCAPGASCHVKTPRVQRPVGHLRMTHGAAAAGSDPSQRPMRISSTNSPRIRTCRRRTLSSTKPRDSYRRRARWFVAKTASSAFAKPRTRIHSSTRSIMRRPSPTSRQPSWIEMPTPPTWRSFRKAPAWQSAAPMTSPSATATKSTFRTPSNAESQRRSSSRLGTSSIMM